MQSADQLHRFTFEQANVRGEMVQLQASYREILDSYAYPSVIQTLLGEMMAATSLLTATLKFEGEISLQLQSEGAVKYVVINGTHDQKLRGVARWDEALETLPESFQELFVKGVLVITITPDQGERYQGVVPLDRPTLGECLEGYFEQSEQLLTQVRLHAGQSEGGAFAGGTLLQVLPASADATQKGQAEDFEHLAKLTETLSAEELFTLDVQTVLHRLYHQEEVTLYPSQDVVFKCTCSKERSASALANVDKQELLSIVEAEGEIAMNCQYCHKVYRFDAMDIETIHAGFPLNSPAQ